MRALVYGVPPEPFEVPGSANTLTQNLAHTPTALREVPDPQLLHQDWVITRPRLTGICGSDSKQILMDFGEDDVDNAMAAFCSVPQVMGHEVVADVVAVGPKVAADEVAEGIIAALGSDRFEHYVPDMKAVVDVKNADIDAFIAGVAGMAAR